MSNLLCPVCGASSSFAFATNYCKVRRCNESECTHLFSDKRNFENGVMKYEIYENTKNVYDERNKRLIKYLVKSKFIRKNYSILDFGAGTGSLARAIREVISGINITCIEADKSANKILKISGLTAYESISEVSEKFNAILLIEVIEHVEEPVQLLRALNEILQPGGEIFITTPSGEIKDKKKKLHTYSIQEHQQFFTEKSLNLAIKKAGFKDIELKAISSLYPKTGGTLGLFRDFYRNSIRILSRYTSGYMHLTGFAKK